jgi:hypothetical protein
MRILVTFESAHCSAAPGDFPPGEVASKPGNRERNCGGKGLTTLDVPEAKVHGYAGASAGSHLGEAVTKRGASTRRLALGFFFCCAIHATAGIAGRPTMEECLEASDFIRNAALSRDAGVAADTFLDRMSEDFLVIRAFPAELRWFVHDAGDEMFLAKETRFVFEQPSSPDDQSAHFLRVCVDRMTDG